jgi:hypothetical protein
LEGVVKIFLRLELPRAALCSTLYVDRCPHLLLGRGASMLLSGIDVNSGTLEVKSIVTSLNRRGLGARCGCELVGAGSFIRT